MAEKDKKFYWLKLKDTFMTSDTVDFLMSQKNGANYVVLYQVLCLKTINTNGTLARTIGEMLIPYDAEKIQRDCKWFDIDTVRVALELYKNLGLVYLQDNGILKITDFENLVGSETYWAKQKRLERLNISLANESNGQLENNETTDVGQCPTNVQNPLISNIYNLNSSNILYKDNKEKEYIEKENSIIDKPCTNEQKFEEQPTQPCKIKKASKDILQEKEIIDYLNEQAKTRYTACKSNTKFIAARLKEYSLEDLKSVIDCKCKEWKGTNMEMYLRPETLFNATKFESYYNQALLEKDKQADCKVKEVSNGIFKI